MKSFISFFNIVNKKYEEFSSTATLTELHIELSLVVFCMPKYKRFVVEQTAKEPQSKMLSVFGVHCAMVL